MIAWLFLWVAVLGAVSFVTSAFQLAWAMNDEPPSPRFTAVITLVCTFAVTLIGLVNAFKVLFCGLE